MKLFAQIGTLILFAASAYEWTVGLPAGTLATVLHWAGPLTLLAHVFELPVAWPRIKAAGGSAISHIVLTLIFGFFHWNYLPKQTQA